MSTVFVTTPNEPSWITGIKTQHFADKDEMVLTTGSGAPGASTPGVYYFRTDTPGVANQRLYVNNAGTWTGIL